MTGAPASTTREADMARQTSRRTGPRAHEPERAADGKATGGPHLVS